MDGKLSRTLLRRIFDSFSTTVLRRRSVPRVSSALCDGNRSLGNSLTGVGVQVSVGVTRIASAGSTVL